MPLAFADVALRWLQFSAASLLIGTPFFVLWAPVAVIDDPSGVSFWIRRLLIACAALTLGAAVASLFLQTAIMAGSLADGFDPKSFEMVLFTMPLGWALGARMALSALALAILFYGTPSPPLWLALSLIGVAIAATFALTGHGAGGEGLGKSIHLICDIVHVQAAAIWISALVVLTRLSVRSPGGEGSPRSLALALRRFSGLGSMAVAALVASGLVNSGFLVGVHGLAHMLDTEYGLMLSFKILIFLTMFGFALVHRLVLAPRLLKLITEDGDANEVLKVLRRSLTAETLAGLAVLGVVSLLGTLAPISAQ